MKTLILISLIFICISSVAKTPSFTPALTEHLAVSKIAAVNPFNDIINKMNRLDQQQLYFRFSEHFGRFVGENPQDKVDFDFIVGEQSSATTSELLFLFGVGYGLDMDITPFAEFGILPDGKNGYQIDFKKTPFLVEPFKFFGRLFGSDDLDSYEDHLRQRGLRNKDIRALKAYLTKHDMEDFEQQGRRQNAVSINALLPQLKTVLRQKSILASNRYDNRFKAMSFVKHNVLQSVARDRGLKMFATLDSKSQRILQSYLVEQVRGHLTATVLTDFSEENRYWEDIITSGSLDRELDEVFTEYSMEREQ